MRNAYKYKSLILENFYLDDDDITIRRKVDSKQKGRFKKDQIVIPYILRGNKRRDYKGITIPGSGTHISLPWILTVLRGIDFEPDSVLDHIDGDYTNNSRENIRVTTQAINCKNRKLRCDNKTGYAGLTQKNDKYGYWTVRRTLNGVRKSKTFKTKEEAIKYLESIKEQSINDGYTERHIKENVQRPSKARLLNADGS